MSSYKEPVIVTGCDGVGTKTEILFELDMVETAGKDLVAMNVNDILTTGGDPLLFLDYLGISNLERNAPASPAWWPACATTWNPATASWPEETAEMPGVVPESIVELSGFCIGCCEKAN
ncbi:MAG: AIR synthase related protein [Akkermansia sp.]